MQMTYWLKRRLKQALAAQGYQISRLPSKPLPITSAQAKVEPDTGLYRGTMGKAIPSLAARLGSVATIIDVGASNGMWTEVAMQSFPNSQYLLIEAQPVHLAALNQFCAGHPNASYVAAAAGAAAGQIYFNVASPLGGRASYTPFASHNAVVPVTTIDQEVRAHQLPGPFLLKLDTHGFEVPIFEGARATLPNTAAIIVECYNFKSNPECLLFYEMCAWLQERGFRCIDLLDVMRRPKDDVLWQMDLVLVRADRPEFETHKYV